MFSESISNNICNQLYVKNHITCLGLLPLNYLSANLWASCQLTIFWCLEIRYLTLKNQMPFFFFFLDILKDEDSSIWRRAVINSCTKMTNAVHLILCYWDFLFFLLPLLLFLISFSILLSEDNIAKYQPSDMAIAVMTVVAEKEKAQRRSHCRLKGSL